MNLTVNGQPAEISFERIADLLRAQGLDPDRNGIAVAVNGSVIPRRVWGDHRLRDGDDVEIITAMQGG